MVFSLSFILWNFKPKPLYTIKYNILLWERKPTKNFKRCFIMNKKYGLFKTNMYNGVVNYDNNYPNFKFDYKVGNGINSKLNEPFVYKW